MNSAFPSRKMGDCELAHTFCFWKPYKHTRKMAKVLSFQAFPHFNWKNDKGVKPANGFQDTLFLCGKPLFATPCCNTSRATWSTPSEPSHKKPFFEVLSFSTFFGSGCCRQLVCFEFGVLRFRLPLYTRNGQVGEPSCCGFWFWSWLAAVVNLFVLKLLCFISVCLYPKRADYRTHVQRRNKKDLAPPSRVRGSTWDLFLQVC